MPRLTLMALLVRGYDEAIAFYAGKLGFEVRLDTRLAGAKRWVVVAQNGGGGAICSHERPMTDNAPPLASRVEAGYSPSSRRMISRATTPTFALRA